MRHDVPRTNWAWGGQINRYRGRPRYRLDQVSLDWASGGYMWGFVEHKDLFGLTGTVFFGNIIDQDDNYRRAIYAPRRDGELVQVETRRRNFGPVVTFRLRGTF